MEVNETLTACSYFCLELFVQIGESRSDRRSAVIEIATINDILTWLYIHLANSLGNRVNRSRCSVPVKCQSLEFQSV